VAAEVNVTFNGAEVARADGTFMAEMVRTE